MPSAQSVVQVETPETSQQTKMHQGRSRLAWPHKASDSGANVFWIVGIDKRLRILYDLAINQFSLKESQDV